MGKFDSVNISALLALINKQNGAEQNALNQSDVLKMMSGSSGGSAAFSAGSSIHDPLYVQQKGIDEPPLTVLLKGLLKFGAIFLFISLGMAMFEEKAGGQVSLTLNFYILLVTCVMWSDKLDSPVFFSIVLYNITSIAYNHRTDFYPLESFKHINIYIYPQGGMGKMLGLKNNIVHQAEKSDKSFDDVVGIDEAKGELEEIVQYLQNPKQFTRLGGKLPKGVRACVDYIELWALCAISLCHGYHIPYRVVHWRANAGLLSCHTMSPAYNKTNILIPITTTTR